MFLILIALPHSRGTGRFHDAQVTGVTVYTLIFVEPYPAEGGCHGKTSSNKRYRQRANRNILRPEHNLLPSYRFECISIFERGTLFPLVCSTRNYGYSDTLACNRSGGARGVRE